MRKTVLSCLLLLICLAASLEAGVNHWTPIGPFGGQMLSVAADPQRAGVVYAGTWGGIFKSTDGGATWRRTARGLGQAVVHSLAVAPSNSRVIYAGTSRGVFVSRDEAETWQATQLTSDEILAVAVDPRDPRRVWVGTSGNVAWSRDGGATWSFAEETDEGPILRVPEIAIDPVHPDTVYALSRPLEDQDVLKAIKTTDGGATWTQGEGLDAESYSYDSLQLAVDPTAPNVVYAALGLSTEEGVTYRSTDGGATWHRTLGTFPVTVDRKGVAYAGRMRSTDHGETWQDIGAPPRPVEYAANTATATGTGILWAATERSGVYRSTDGGTTWQPSSQGLHAVGVLAVAVDPALPRAIYAATNELGMVKTFSSGLRWRGLPSGVDMTFIRDVQLAVDPREPQTVYLAWDFGFARSDNGGASWKLLSDHHSNLIRLVIHPETGAVYISGSFLVDDSEICRLARSTDRGETFRCLAPFNNSDVNDNLVRVFLDAENNLWATEWRDSALWKSTDGGEHWTVIRPRGLERAGMPLWLTSDPSRPNRLFLTAEAMDGDDRPERVWRSNDGGRSWQPWGKGIPSSSWVRPLLVDPVRPSILYAAVQDHGGTGSGVYQSRDGGRTFKPIRDGLPGNVTHLILDPSDSRRLYAGTPHNGIYTYTYQKKR